MKGCGLSKGTFIPSSLPLLSLSIIIIHLGTWNHFQSTRLRSSKNQTNDRLYLRQSSKIRRLMKHRVSKLVKQMYFSIVFSTFEPFFVYKLENWLHHWISIHYSLLDHSFPNLLKIEKRPKIQAFIFLASKFFGVNTKLLEI